MIQAVLLDLGNVIVPVDFARCHEGLARVCAQPPERVPQILRESGLPARYEQGRISTEEFYEATCRLLQMKVSRGEFAALWNNMFPPETLVPEAMLDGLRRRARLLLVSNTNQLHFAYLKERYALLRHFDDYVLSYEVGAMKPAREIYEEAIARAGCRPQECFFADDVAANVEGARQAGIDAVQFQSVEQLQEELRRRKVQW